MTEMNAPVESWHWVACAQSKNIHNGYQRIMDKSQQSKDMYCRQNKATLKAGVVMYGRLFQNLVGRPHSITGIIEYCNSHGSSTMLPERPG